jgi:release factor glutamine methyltransferase
MSFCTSVAGLLANATERLAESLRINRREARIEARVLLAHVLRVNHAWLIAHDRDTPEPTQCATVRSLIERRAAGEPVAYILGQREFFGLEFDVSPAVLIPRPDTELLVECVLARTPENAPCRILDLGSGSGAIAVTLALERPLANVWAVDISAEALAITQANARKLGAGNLQCLASNWYDTLGDHRFDLIVSNPPYIAANDPHLLAGDLRFEPRQALASGDDGLHDLRAIVAGAPAHLLDGGWLLLEHGFDQADAVSRLLQQQRFSQTFALRDLAGLDRVSGGRWSVPAG